MRCSFNYYIIIILSFCTCILSFGHIVSFTVRPIKQFWIELICHIYLSIVIYCISICLCLSIYLSIIYSYHIYLSCVIYHIYACLSDLMCACLLQVISSRLSRREQRKRESERHRQQSIFLSLSLHLHPQQQRLCKALVSVAQLLSKPWRPPRPRCPPRPRVLLLLPRSRPPPRSRLSPRPRSRCHPRCRPPERSWFWLWAVRSSGSSSLSPFCPISSWRSCCPPTRSWPWPRPSAVDPRPLLRWPAPPWGPRKETEIWPSASTCWSTAHSRVWRTVMLDTTTTSPKAWPIISSQRWATLMN